MKKIFIITCIVFLFSATSVFAQYAYFGLKGGINLASFNGSESDAADWGSSTKGSRFGFTVGAYSTIVLAKVFAIQPEALFTMNGAKYEDKGLTTAGSAYTDTMNINLNYIQIPVLLKFYVPVPGMVKPNVFAGGYLGINISHKYKYEYEVAGTVVFEEEGDIDDYFLGLAEITTLDYGPVFGGGIDFIVAGMQMSVDARYSLGLADLLEVATGTEFSIKNGAFSIMYGIGF